MLSIKTITAVGAGAVAIGLSVGGIAPAEAVCLPSDCKTVTYQGFNYDVGKVTGQFSALQSVLTQQPWWDSDDDAAAIASLVADQLDSPNVGSNFAFGPFFAFASPEIPNSLYAFGSVNNNPPELVGRFFSPGDRTQTYAIVTDSVPIPTPALLPGLLGMGIAVWRKRKGEEASGQDPETAEV